MIRFAAAVDMVMLQGEFGLTMKVEEGS